MRFKNKYIFLLVFIVLIFFCFNIIVLADNDENPNIDKTNSLSEKSIFSPIIALLECFYYIAGIFALGAIFINSKQNKLLQTEINNNLKYNQISFEREIALTTINLCEKFATDVIPLTSEVIRKINTNEIITFEKNIFVEDDFNAKDVYMQYKKMNIYLDTETFKLCITTANKLEAYSMYFTEKICNEKIAYKAIGQVFTQAVKHLYPYILMYRIEYRSVGYSNIIKLYLIWIKRIENEKIENKESELEKQENELKQKKVLLKKRKSDNIEEIKPLGANN